MIADSQGVGDDRQRRIDGRAGDEETSVDDVEVIEVMGFAVSIQYRCFGICSEAHGAVLVPDASNGNPFSEVGQVFEEAVAHADVVQDVLKLLLQSLVAFAVIFRVTELDLPVFAHCDAVIRIGEVFRRQPEVDGVVRHVVQDESRSGKGGIGFEHIAIGFSEHLDMPQRILRIGSAEVKIVDRHRLLKLRGVGLSRQSDHRGIVMAHVMSADAIGAICKAGWMLRRGRAQKERGGIDRPAGDDHDVALVDFLVAMMPDDDL